jgi:hypothetical protein
MESKEIYPNPVSANFYFILARVLASQGCLIRKWLQKKEPKLLSVEPQGFSENLAN